ncbi:M48 family metallopeptidase [Phaeobacter sp. PT47_59]|uniref:M48 family metallopeptidase n=1 Tax=Phaeobacter sp. PT47_59 TaxID=3029979 RepID=UPI002380893B|nr:M48 family metallopeptidase [Phaeobacter sp. PT47_59]MDE4175615.1 M48 family metallopeptidase [Phaeobacter sp. PT47_59]
MRRVLIACALVALSACAVQVPPLSEDRPVPPGGAAEYRPGGVDMASFRAVVARVEPVAERICRTETQGMNCDFAIGIDPNPKAAPNAYQSLARSGRPVITFTQSMLGQLGNADELAFVMAHETAHHIEGHLARQQQNAAAGSVLLAGLATLAGGTAADVSNAQDLGAIVGARSYSKAFELEADRLGTIITHKSGYRPSVGVQFFSRLPDPGDMFLGSHPANPDRVRVVQDTISRYGLN